MAAYDFLELLTDVITIERRIMASSNGYPQGQYAPAKQYPCRISAKPKMIRTADGNEKVSDGQITVATDWLMVGGVPTQQAADIITTADFVTYPDQGLGRTPVMHLELVHDEAGLHHTVIYT